MAYQPLINGKEVGLLEALRVRVESKRQAAATHAYRLLQRRYGHPRRVLNTLRYIHANPLAAGIRRGFYDPYSNYGHYGRLESDGISEWHPSFLQLAPTLKGCFKRYERFCQKYRHHAKGAPKCHWGSRMLKRLVEIRGSNRSKSKRISSGQQQLPFAFDCQLNQIPDDWHQVAVRIRQANGIRDGGREQSIW
jgi:hypothetical protein